MLGGPISHAQYFKHNAQWVRSPCYSWAPDFNEDRALSVAQKRPSIQSNPGSASREAFDVGARLKGLRIAKELSQRDLADRAGITNGMISMIEQNKHSPSVATLNRLTDALGLSFAEFFSLHLAAEPQPFYRESELTRLTEGKVQFSVVAAERLGKALQILHEVYEPGGDTGAEMLTHRGEEGGLVVQGEIELTVGDQTRVLGVGDAYYFESTTPHRFRNTGKTRAIVISACTPPFL